MSTSQQLAQEGLRRDHYGLSDLKAIGRLERKRKDDLKSVWRNGLPLEIAQPWGKMGFAHLDLNQEPWFPVAHHEENLPNAASQERLRS